MKKLSPQQFCSSFSSAPDDGRIFHVEGGEWEARCPAGVLAKPDGSTGFDTLESLLSMLADVGIRRMDVEWDGLAKATPATNPKPTPARPPEPADFGLPVDVQFRVIRGSVESPKHASFAEMVDFLDACGMDEATWTLDAVIAGWPFEVDDATMQFKRLD